MFGTMGFSELMIILVIVLIIFGAGRLPQIGEGVGKALRGFKKEVHDVPPPPAGQVEAATSSGDQIQAATTKTPAVGSTTPVTPSPTAPHAPGPAMTPGTTASQLYQTGPQAPQVPPAGGSPSAGPATSQQAVTMEQRDATPSPVMRAQYPPLPAGAQAKPTTKRPSAIVNKDAVARVQAQQAAMKAKAEQSGPAVTPNDMEAAGEGFGGLVRSFQQAVADVRSSVDPEMRTIHNEIDAAQKEIQQTFETARENPTIQEDPSKPA